MRANASHASGSPSALLGLLTLAIAAVASPSAGAAEAGSQPPRPALAPCESGIYPPEALCGTFEVYENRASRSGRKVPLAVVLIPNGSPQRSADPFVFLPIEPGEGAILRGIARYYELAPVRRKRDLLLVDLRGTGSSRPLSCPELEGPERVQAALDSLFPAGKVAACRESLKAEADLSWYTSDAAVDDLEEIRSAFGFETFNLMGAGHGARLALNYLRRHPADLRTVTLLGPTPPGEPSFPGLYRNGRKELASLYADCAADPACQAAFPKLREDEEAALRLLTAKPVRVELTDPQSGASAPLVLHRDSVARTLVSMLGAPASAASLPLRLHQAAQGNWKPFALSAEASAGTIAHQSVLVALSVACAEDLPLLAKAAPAGGPDGDFAVRQLRAACQGWPVREPGADLHSPVASDVPVLLIAGGRDPATPPSDGERVAATLKRSRRVVMAEAPNDYRGMVGNECIPTLIAAFVAAGSAEGLDVSCVASMRRPAFDLPEVTVSKADLEPLAGTYRNEESGFALQIDLAGERLRVTVLAGPPFPPTLLTPVSKTHYRWEGEGLITGLELEFQRTDGKATGVTVVQAGKPPLAMRRAE